MTRPPSGIVLAGIALFIGILHAGSARAQRTLHWVGGNGDWSDARHWSTAQGGTGGAGAPSAKDAVVIGPVDGDVVIRLGGKNAAASLHVDGEKGQVGFRGEAGSLALEGDLVLDGNVDWAFAGTLRLTADPGSVLRISTRGIPLGSTLALSGGGAFTLANDLVLREGRALELNAGTLVLNGSLLKADELHFPGGKARKLIAGSSVILLAQAPEPADVRNWIDRGSSRMLIGGVPMAFGNEPAMGADGARSISQCGVGAGQTLFSIEAVLMSNYNGFGVSCHSACDGIVKVTPTGGVGPFSYAWIGGPNTATWTNVCPGNQIVIVTDQGQNVSCATTVQVTDPARLSVIFTSTVPPSCGNTCDGTSTALAVGGVPDYGYSWNNGAGTDQTFSNLCPGANTLHVTDANGCAFDTTFNFPVVEIKPHLNKTNVQCNGDCNGAAQVAPTGGSGGYTYNWLPGDPAGDGTSAISGLCPGNYGLTITDSHGCDTTIAFVIHEPAPILPQAGHVDASCASNCDGSATVAPTGGSGNYTYTWVPTPGGGGSGPTATGLCVGTYQVTITDNATGCDTVVSFVISSPPIIVPVPSSTDATCAMACDGTADVPATGGIAPLIYVWTPTVVGQGTPHAEQLCPGTYSVTISDGAGCDTTIQFLISAPSPLQPSTDHTDVSCTGACDGTAGGAVTGGTGPYTYSWSPTPPLGQGTPVASNLCAGPISLTITDVNGCDTTVQYLIEEPGVLTLVASQTDLTCGSTCNGTASVVASGGSSAYTYAWSPVPPQGQGTPIASQLCAGTWTVTVTDAHGCQKSHAFTILPASPVLASVQTTPISCDGVCDGTATAVVSGGVAPHTIVWSPTPGGGQGTLHATGLCAGPGSLTVTDAQGCDTTITFVIAAPPPIQVAATVTDAQCSGVCDGSITLVASGGTGPITYAWTPASAGNGPSAVDLCAGSYQVVITSGDCDTTLSFTVGQPTALALTVTSTPSSCADLCSGTATLNGNVSGYAIVWSPAPGSGQGSPQATGLCSGGYSVTVSNGTGCDTTISFTISAPPPLVPDLQVVNASCGTACDGSAVCSVTGGASGYTFLWSPAPATGQGTPAVGGLCPGSYTVTVTDASGCDTTLAFAIARPSGIAAVATITPATCSSLCDGAVSVNATGGVDPYTWTWSPQPGTGQGTSTVGGLCPGVWALTIADQAGCDTTLNFNVGSPDAIDPHGTFTHESCQGPCDGTATLMPTGGTGVFSYTWLPASAGSGSAASGLCAGTYSVTVSDGTSCDTTWTFTVLPTTPIQATVQTVDGMCHGDCTGEGIVTASGGAGGFSYHWSPEPAAGQGTAHATGFCAGQGTVVVTDAGGCDTTLTFSIFKNTAVQPNLLVAGENCAGPCSGEAAVYPVGGVGPYTYLWVPAPQSGDADQSTAIGLCAGTAYTVTITDSLGCDTTVAFTVPPFVPIVPAVSVSPATCANSCDGTATASATGGTMPYQLTWSPVPPNGQGVITATGLCTGTYLLTITDNNGCDSTISFSITSPPPIVPNATVTDLSCAGQCNGAIDLNTQGGTGGYAYAWSPEPPSGNGTAHVSGLCAGDWTVSITDGVGCDTSITFTVTEPLPMSVDLDVVSSQCGVCSGSVMIHGQGGQGPYSFLFGPPLNLSTTDSLITGLCAGIHSATMTDALGCTLQFAVVVDDMDGEVLSITNGRTSCPGLCDAQVSVAYACSVAPCTVSWSDALGNPLGASDDMVDSLCAGTYLVTVVNGDGCISIDTAIVTEPAGLVPSFSSTPVSCIGDCDGTGTIGLTGGVGPFTFTWSPAPGGTGQGTHHATGLCAGMYAVHVDDLGGCDLDLDLLITAPQPIAIDPVVSDMGCFGSCDGSIVLNVQGGTGAMHYLWSPAPAQGQGTGAVSGLCPGTYSVRVFDGNNCDTTFSFTLVEPQPITLSGAVTSSHCTVCDGTAQVVAAGGVAPISVVWTANGVPVGTDTTLTGLCAGVYAVTATDAHGCTTQQVFVVPDATADPLLVTDGSTPCFNSCEGTVSVTYACAVAPCVTTWLDASGIQLAQGADTLNGLCPGTYFVQVVNGDGCSALDTAYVVPAHSIVPNLSTTPTLCQDDCNGTATVGPTGGTAPYTYAWSTGDTTAHVTGLCAGTHTVTITDSIGCDTLVAVLILPPPPIAVVAQVEEVSCNASCDGSIVLNVSGGSGSYSYVWAPAPPSGLGTNGAYQLCAGAWSVTVADAHGCDTTLVFTLAEPAPLAIDATTTQSDCNVCNGSAAVQVSGGAAPYAVSWLQGASILGTDSLIDGLCAGLYSAEVQDANGCTAQVPVPINDNGGEEVTASSALLTCPTSCDGEVYVDHGCTVPTCTVAWFYSNGSSMGQSGDTLTGLCAGTYFVQVTNGAGCITLDTARVVPPPVIQAHLSTVPETCAGSCDGTATVAPTGGDGPPYTYVWQPEVTGQGTAHATALCAGTYSVTITDASGCSIQQGVVILSPLAITASSTVTPITCNGSSDGSITVVGQGGTGVIGYAWAPEPPVGQGTGTASGLGAGTWAVTLSDAHGCDTTLAFTLTDPSAIVVDLTHTDNVCYNSCVATAHAVITGGTMPYAITWTGPDGTVLDQDVVDVYGLCAGDHQLTVTDSIGCGTTVTFTVGAGTPINANMLLQGESCNGPCDGRANIVATGGSGSGYAFQWQPDVTGQGTPQATELCPGTYAVTITDGIGCDTTYALTITPFTLFQTEAEVEAVSCNGACDGTISLNVSGGAGGNTYTWVPEPPVGQGTAAVSGLCPQSWSVTITDVAGCDTTVAFEVTEPLPLAVAIDEVHPASCASAMDGSISMTIEGGTPGFIVSWVGPNGFTSSSEDLTGLAGGAYDVTVTDQHACSITVQVAVAVLRTVVADAGPDVSACTGHTVILDGSASQGSSSYEWKDPDGTVMGSNVTLELPDLTPGVHSFVLQAMDGPCTDTDTVTVEVFDSPLVDAGPDQEVFIQGTVVLGGQPSGPAGSQFSWRPDSLLDHANIPDPTATVEQSTWFHLTVTTTEGCIGVDSVLVTVVPEIKVPSGFTPNGDGHNDDWVLDFVRLFPGIDVRVFSRWGEPLFHSVGYSVPWDGKVNGTVVPVGTYYYAIELNDPRFPDALTGPLTVIR